MNQLLRLSPRPVRLTRSRRWLAGAALLAGLLTGAAGRAEAQTPTWQTACRLPGPLAIPGPNRVTDAAGDVYEAGTFAGFRTLGAFTLVSNGGTPDAYVARFTPTGGCVWAVRAGDFGADAATDLALDPAGNVVVTGRFSGTAAFGPVTLTSQGGTDLFVAPLSAAGVWLGATGAGSTADDQGLAVALDAAGDALVAGTFGAPFTLGTTPLPTAGAGDLLVAKLLAGGGWAWAAAVSAPLPAPSSFSSLRVTALTTDGTGNVTLAGQFANTTLQFGSTVLVNGNIHQFQYDGFVAQLSAAGQWRWARGMAGAADDQCADLAADGAGNLYVCGSFNSDTLTFAGLPDVANSHPGGSLGFDGYVAMLTPAGAWAWAMPVASVGFLSLYALAVEPTGRLYLAGGYSGTATFGGTTLANTGAFDVLVAALTPARTWAWAVASTGNSGSDNSGTALSLAVPGQLIVTGYLSSGVGRFGSVVVPASGTFRARLGIPLGTDDDDGVAPGFTLFPNPARGTATLRAPFSGAGAPTATLLDALGRVVRTYRLEPKTSPLDLAGLPAGLYTVRAGGRARRLVVE